MPLPADTPPAPLVVLDDDPTGTQAAADVPVLLEWSREDLDAAVADAPASIHLLTNARALPGDRARDLVTRAVRQAREAIPAARFLLRGDSTLRAHLLEEYLAVCDAAHDGRHPPLLLSPALPAAGRITVDGVHLLERDGVRTPLDRTEYARDPSFVYDDAHLLQWAHDRSNGVLAHDRGRTVPLARLRAEGPEAVATSLAELDRAGGRAVCVPDAETDADVELVAEGLRLAWSAGTEVVARGSPTFAAALAGTASTAPAPMPDGSDGVLLVCGSYVATTGRQLAALDAAHPGVHVEADVLSLADPEAADGETERLAHRVAILLERDGLAILSTPRRRPRGTHDLASGERIAINLARVVTRLERPPSAVIAKGGITSAVTARVGLGCRLAHTVGPVAPGVALWRIVRDDGHAVAYLVVPGNVGGDDLLVDLVTGIVGVGGGA